MLLVIKCKFGSINTFKKISCVMFSSCYSYEACWRSIMHEADGVILIYNPDSPGQDQQIGDWYDFFVRKNGLKDEQCLVFAHRLGQGSSDRFRPRKFP